MTVIAIDVGMENALTIDTNAPDDRSIMLSSAAALVATTLDMEGKLAETAKTWGAKVFSLAYPSDSNAKTVTLDALIGDSKVAAGWSSLTTTDAGKKAKARMEVYFSNARLVAESFDALSDDDKRDIRAGISSIHYRAGLIRKAASDAKKAAKKEAERVAAEQAASDSAAEATAPVAEQAAPVAPASLADMLAAVLAAIETASDDDLNAAYPMMGAAVDAFDARINAATATEAQAA